MKIRHTRKKSDTVQKENAFFDKEKGLSKNHTDTRNESDAFFQTDLTVGSTEHVQRQGAEEEEMAQPRLDIQRQGMEEEEPVQAQGMEEEEMAQTKIQRQGMEEEESVQPSTK